MTVGTNYSSYTSYGSSTSSTEKTSKPNFEEIAAEMLSSMDTDGDGSISSTEFTTAASNNSNAGDIFSLLDTDSSGSMSTEEFVTALKNMKPPEHAQGESEGECRHRHRAECPLHHHRVNHPLPQRVKARMRFSPHWIPIKTERSVLRSLWHCLKRNLLRVQQLLQKRPQLPRQRQKPMTHLKRCVMICFKKFSPTMAVMPLQATLPPS